MKVENHDTAKLGSQHENLLKREIQRMWTNIKLCLTTYIVHVIVLEFPHSTVIVRILMGVAWVGILPRQGIWGHSRPEAIDLFWGEFFVKILTFW